MNYREYLPSAALRPYVDCYWHYKTDSMAAQAVPVQRCLPLGTVEIIMQIDCKPCRIMVRDGIWEQSGNIYFTGLFTDTAFWQAAPDSIMFGIRLKPESLIELFKVPAAVLFNSVVNAEDVLGKTGLRMYQDMTGIFSPMQLVALAEKHLLTRLNDLSASAGEIDHLTPV